MRRRLLSSLASPPAFKSGESSGFALGWKVDTVPLAGASLRVVRHRASLIGGYATLSLFPERGLAIAAMSTGQNALIDGLALQIAEAFMR